MNEKPVVALDIDGTLGDYWSHFISFASAYLGRELPKVEEARGLSLPKHLHISKATYRQVKLAYRQGGMKRSMPCYPYASELTRNLRKAGAEVWICTTRPYLRLDNIDPDTRHWLRRHRIQYDGVIFGERKYRELHSIVGSRFFAALDDLPEMCQQAQQYATHVVMRSQPYNAETALDAEIPIVSSLWLAETYFLNMLRRTR